MPISDADALQDAILHLLGSMGEQAASLARTATSPICGKTWIIHDSKTSPHQYNEACSVYDRSTFPIAALSLKRGGNRNTRSGRYMCRVKVGQTRGGYSNSNIVVGVECRVGLIDNMTIFSKVHGVHVAWIGV